MENNVTEFRNLFKGTFLASPEELKSRLQTLRAFVFDWDGVFNNGVKNANGSSSFSEVDSMGTNMLRFCSYLQNGVVPFTAIITGENNVDAYTFARRESLGAVYFGIKHKQDAFHHLCASHNLKPSEIAFFFDDVLDLSVAATAGVRIMVGRECNPLMNQYVSTHNLADYITGCDGGRHAIREACELIIGLSGNYNETLANRIQYSENYRRYLTERNAGSPVFYTVEDGTIAQTPQS